MPTPASYKQGKEVYPVPYLLDGEDHSALPELKANLDRMNQLKAK